MTIYKPYTYLIGWSKHDKWYYGVRYAKKCNPDELGKTYFTSSKYVKSFLSLNGLPDIIQIRKIFKNSKDARLWEHKALRRLKVVTNDKWINKTDNISIDPQQALLGCTKSKSDNFKEKCRINRIGKKHTEETKEKIRQKAIGREGYWKGKNLSETTKTKLSNIGKTLKGKKNPFFGKKHSEDTKKKISISKKHKTINIEYS